MGSGRLAARARHAVFVCLRGCLKSSVRSENRPGAMAMAPATRAPGGAAAATRLVSNKSGFSAPSPIRLPRHAAGSRAAVLGVAARSGRRDGWPGADSNSSSSSSGGGGGGGGGRLVDADMATLRRRIREARAESAEEDGIDADGDEADGGGLALLPAEWTELERRHHGSYVAGVRGAVGLLEALLLSARPGLGAGLLAVLLLGVPASLFLACAQLMQIGR
ncbi:unnamed protein product [Urochloa decumbens]|uniref:Uncharacterized protein n=1 Tax=Urochloa decumbens TaxID=240449 RepID=A0ABC8WFG9_9POAL